MSAPATTLAWPADRWPAAQEVKRYLLDNGLRVVINHVADIAAVGINVSYDVGYRSERMPGFAHLFEHLMFGGSLSLPPQAHATQIQENGGVCNATTWRDHTSYFDVLPARALDLGLFLEADRMRGLRLTEEKLRTQTRVVTEEIRRNVTGRPYGGFPWVELPKAVFGSFANTHNGYGDVESLSAASLDDCEEFFAQYYCPANAVLTICGPVNADDVMDSVVRHFATIASRAAPPARDLREPASAADTDIVVDDPLAPTAATALGWRVPDPASQSYLPNVVLASVLSDGEESVLRSSIVRGANLASQAMATAALTGRPFECRDPEVFLVSATHRAGVSFDDVCGGVSQALESVALDGVTDAQLHGVRCRLKAAWYAEHDPIGARACRIGAAELFYGAAEIVQQYPEQLDGVAVADVAKAAADLLLQPRSSLFVRAKNGEAQ